MPAPTFVQQAQGGASASPSSFTVTFGANVAAGNAVLLCVGTVSGTVGTPTGLGGTWTNLGADNGAGFWLCTNPNGSTSVVTVNVSGTVDAAACASEWATLTGTDIAIAHQTGLVTTAPQTMTALSQTPSSYPYLLLLDFNLNTSASAVGAPTGLGTGWTALTAKNQGTHCRVDPRYKIITTPSGTYTAQWTEATNGSFWQAFGTFRAGGLTAVNGSATLAGTGDLRANGAVVVPDNPLPLEVRVYAAANPLGAPLAVWEGQTGLQWSDLFNETGAGRLTLPLSDAKATTANLAKYNLVRVFLGPFDVFQFWIETPQYTVAGIAGAADEQVLVAGRSLEAYLSRALVWLSGTGYAGATAGMVMLDMVQAAQARGAISLLKTDFTLTLDSAGVAWAGTLADLTLGWTEGADMLSVLSQLRGLGVIARMRPDMTLQLYQSYGVNQRAVGVVLRQGRHLTTPVTWTLPDAHAANVMMTRGTPGVAAVLTDGGGLGNPLPDRFEGYLKGPDSDDLTTLYQAATTEILARYAAASAIALREVDHGLGPGQYEPYRHYGLGDTIGLDVPGRFTNTPEVVKAITGESGDRARYTLGLDLSGLQPDRVRDLAIAVRRLQQPSA